MDPALIPRTAPGRQLGWLMSLRAEPSADEIGDHFEPAAGVDIQVDLPGPATESAGLAWGLLAFGTMVRDLPGLISCDEDARLCLQLEQGARVLCGVVSIDHGGSGKVMLVVLREHFAEHDVALDRIRQAYDRVADTYERVGADRAHYWVHAKAWLHKMTSDGATVLDVGCGTGHLAADLPPSVRVIGCDVSPEMVRLAALARPTGSFIVHDYHQPFPARWSPADVSVAFGCLDFCTDLPQVARNLAAATKHDGRLMLTVPRAEPMSRRREITVRPLPLAEITLRSWEDVEVEAALGTANLEVITHRAGPGWSSPDVGTVEYGYWELKPGS